MASISLDSNPGDEIRCRDENDKYDDGDGDDSSRQTRSALASALFLMTSRTQPRNQMQCLSGIWSIATLPASRRTIPEPGAGTAISTLNASLLHVEHTRKGLRVAYEC